MIDKVNSQSTTGAFRSVSLYHGIQSRVANKLGVSRQFVSAVVRGKQLSRRVERAIRKELARIDGRRLAA